MDLYSSSITFLYYDNYEKAIFFFEKVLRLSLVMDQGWARVYKVSNGSFLGMVKKEDGSIQVSNKGGALFSMNALDLEECYDHIKSFQLNYLTEINVIESIPLKSFFFKDFEGYDFEIQEFLDVKDKNRF
jgi:predicted enzyme related to lactoylglutathione lyase